MKICSRPTAQLRCPFCHDSVEVADARICPACSSAQHPACDLAHGGCAVCVVYGKQIRLLQEPRRRSRQESRRRSRQESRARSAGGSRRGDEGGRRGSFGLAALVSFLAMIVSACLLPLTLEPSGMPSGWSILATLCCVLSAGGSLLCYLVKRFSLRPARREAARECAGLLPLEKRRAWIRLSQVNGLNLLAVGLALAAPLAATVVTRGQYPLVAASLLCAAGALACWARRIQRRLWLWAASRAAS